ncbi:MAG: hypothetical protein FWG55_06430 [Candidatus Bathyarchaeota archaeon]|nr:hypothetical protein [Candidatus Termiticorpusculum sp.]
MNIKSKFDFRCFHNRKTLIFVSTLFMVALVSSFLASAIINTSPFALGAPDKTVNNETELKNAINNAPSKTSTIIALNNDISLSSSLTIPANKDITLTSNKNGFYKLIGKSDEYTINVTGYGMLKLDGIIVTHRSGDSGNGVIIHSDGQLILNSGEISGNIAKGVAIGLQFYSAGGGVINYGTFEMHGGKISNNTAMNGGGVSNSDTFTMSGGEISGNKAYNGGGGVYNHNGVFNRFGGTVSGNIQQSSSDDVCYYYSDVDSGGSGSGGNNSGGSSNGNGGSSGGNNGGSGSNGSGSSGGSGESSNGNGYSLRDVVVICVSIMVVVVGVVTGALFFYFKKKVSQIEAKMSKPC